jgi:hypothetical protein
MNTLEDRRAAALRDTAAEIGPHDVPPLRLNHARHRVPGRSAAVPGVPGGPWAAWLRPLAAAAAVAAVVAASLAVSAAFHGHARGTGPGPVASSHGAPAGSRAALRDVPRYFVALTGEAQIQAWAAAQCRSTVTGRTRATVTPPRPYRVSPG